MKSMNGFLIRLKVLGLVLKNLEKWEKSVMEPGLPQADKCAEWVFCCCCFYCLYMCTHIRSNHHLTVI